MRIPRIKKKLIRDFFFYVDFRALGWGVGAGQPAACTAKKQHSSAARGEAELVKWGTVGKLRSLHSHLQCDIDRSASSFRYGSWRTQARSFEGDCGRIDQIYCLPKILGKTN
jgi:hypothetical protein